MGRHITPSQIKIYLQGSLRNDKWENRSVKGIKSKVAPLMHCPGLRDWKSRTKSDGPCESLHSPHALSSEEDRHTEGDKEEAEEGKEAPSGLFGSRRGGMESAPLI